MAVSQEWQSVTCVLSIREGEPWAARANRNDVVGIGRAGTTAKSAQAECWPAPFVFNGVASAHPPGGPLYLMFGKLS